jgi:hypothetical protein
MHTQLEAADHAGLDAVVTVLDGWMSSLAFMPAWVQPAARKPNMFIGPDVIPQKSCCLVLESWATPNLTQFCLEPVINFAPVNPMESSQLLRGDWNSEEGRESIPRQISRIVHFARVSRIRATRAAPQS